MRIRRLFTVPGYLLAWTLWIGSAPVFFLIAGAIDLARRCQFVALRTAAMITVYLTCEVFGMVASAALLVRKGVSGIDTEEYTNLHFRLEAWWGDTLFRAAVALFDLRLDIEDTADIGRGPYLLFIRHCSIGDTLLAAALISRKHSMHLRYVLKRELLWDPCLDIVGNRLPNVFVDRFSDDSAAEVRRVKELGRDLGPRDGVLIYPEGTRFSESKRSRVLDRFEREGDVQVLEYAGSLAFVLPPRHGGVLGLLEAAPEADVVVCAHTGFEATASLARMWNGELVHQSIRVHFRRIPRAAIPSARNARIDWLREEWRRVDTWVGSHQ